MSEHVDGLLCQGIRKSYGGVDVLRGVDLEVRPGAVTLLIGPSGAGKTSLLRCAALLEEPERGSVTIDRRLYDFPRQAGAELPAPWPEVTVVFQQHFLWPHLTIEQNILLPLGKTRQNQVQSYRELVHVFGMEALVNRYPNQVSIGQRQRAAIMRALVLNPKYILMDEITSALDVEQIHAIFELILRLRQRGIGVLLITHLIGLARGILSRNDGDRLLFLDHGNVCEAGGIHVLDNPQHPRLAEFLSKMQFAH